MFCRYCGNELPDNAKFCNCCGKGVDAKGEQKPVQTDRATEPHQDPSDAIKYKPMSNRQKGILIASSAIVVLALVIVFGVRVANESSLAEKIAPVIYEASKEDVMDHYDNFMDGYKIEYDYDSFEVVDNSGNTFGFNGHMKVIDSSDTSNAYGVLVYGYVVTNWFRTEVTDSGWQYLFDNPEVPANEPEDLVEIEAIYNVFEANAINGQNVYGNKWVNIRGIISSVEPNWNGDYARVTLGFKDQYGIMTIAAYFDFDPNDPNVTNLRADQSVVITGYLKDLAYGTPIFGDCMVYGGNYSENYGDGSSYPNNADGYSNSPEYDEYGNLTDNSPNLPINLSEPFGYYEKADGEGGFSIEYISDDDSVRIEYYSDGQSGYYGGQWFEADFHMSCDYIDFSSDNVLDFVDNDGNSVIRFDAYESYITVTASEPLYGVPVDRINGNYYCKVQSTLLQ